MAIIQKNMNCILNQGARKTKLAFLADASANNGGLKMQFFSASVKNAFADEYTKEGGGGKYHQ